MKSESSPYNNNIPSLVLDLKQGKQEAFRQLFRLYFSDLFHFANTILYNPPVAEDIVQDLFIKLWDKRTHLDEKQSLDSYLYIAVRNSCYTYLKRKIPHVDIDTIQQISVPSTPPEESRALEDQILWDAVEALPFQCKIIFKLIVIEEYSYKETATKLDISVNTVKTQMLRASRSLREKLMPHQVNLLLFTLLHPFQ